MYGYAKGLSDKTAAAPYQIEFPARGAMHVCPSKKSEGLMLDWLLCLSPLNRSSIALVQIRSIRGALPALEHFQCSGLGFLFAEQLLDDLARLCVPVLFVVRHPPCLLQCRQCMSCLASQKNAKHAVRASIKLQAGSY